MMNDAIDIQWDDISMAERIKPTAVKRFRFHMKNGSILDAVDAGDYTAAIDRAESAEAGRALLHRRIEALALQSGWIDATERQPPDAWPRPVIVSEIYGWMWDKLSYYSGQWWAQGQLKEESLHPNKVIFWMEIYPLPNGERPPQE